LKTAAEVGCDPAVEEFHAIGQEPALLLEPAVDRLGVLVAEALDHHEQHDQLSFIAWTRLTPPRVPPPARAAASPAACAAPPDQAPWSASGGCAPRRRWRPASAGRARSG